MNGTQCPVPKKFPGDWRRCGIDIGHVPGLIRCVTEVCCGLGRPWVSGEAFRSGDTSAES